MAKQLNPLTETQLMAVKAGALIRRRREEKGWTLADLTRRTTVTSPQYLHNLESGRVNLSRSKHLVSIQAALELTVQEQALILGVRAAPLKDPEPPVAVDVLAPRSLEMVRFDILGNLGRYAYQFSDEVLIVDFGSGLLVNDGTYMVLVGKEGEASRQFDSQNFKLGVWVSRGSGSPHMLIDTVPYEHASPSTFATCGRVLHRGKNM